MKKVMVMGTFDLFHKGHKYLLGQARKQGDYLVVLVARDATVKKLKGRTPLRSEKQRVKDIKNSGLADKVILGSLKDKYAIIIKEKPDVICLGYDQKFFTDKLAENLKKRGITPIIKRFKAYRPHIYKTSKIASSCCDMKNYLYPEKKD
ncbi:MAG: adenylyltransferase/cytidyltransferase family protein [Nanoarchaeota archaeon]